MVEICEWYSYFGNGSLNNNNWNYSFSVATVERDDMLDLLSTFRISSSKEVRSAKSVNNEVALLRGKKSPALCTKKRSRSGAHLFKNTLVELFLSVEYTVPSMATRETVIRCGPEALIAMFCVVTAWKIPARDDLSCVHSSNEIHSGPLIA